jgi:hypothetical protein
MTENVTIHPAAKGHASDCYGCQGTGRVIGFGHTGKTCPGHRAECEPGFCVCDVEANVEVVEEQPEDYFGPDPWNDRHGDR